MEPHAQDQVAQDQVVRLRAAVSLLGRFPALAGVDLDVGRGEIVLVQGSNGAGKTTLLRTCAGLLPVVSGEASVLGHDLRQAADRSALRRRVGLLGHATGLYEDLTVADNVRFWAKACGATDAEAVAALAALGLDGRLADVVVAKLSAGQRRRTSIATLVARRSEVWLLDEPHAGLDQAGRDVMDRLIRTAAASGATVLVASHELDRAGAIAGRTVTIAGGTVLEDGGSLSRAPPRRPSHHSAASNGRTKTRCSVFRDAVLVAGKDLRVEWRSRVTTNQIAPFAVLVLILFAFALDPDRGVLERATAGLFWIAVLFCALLAVQRAFAIEAVDGNRDALRLSGLNPSGIFLGKAGAVALELAGLELLLGVGVVVLYGTTWSGWLLLLTTCVVATIGLAAAGSLYGVLAAGLRVRETLLPLLLLPVVAPVLLSATRAFEAALDQSPADGWSWVELLSTFAVIYVAFGVLAFGSLLEES